MSETRLPPGWIEARLSDVATINPRNPETPPDDETLVSFVPMSAVEPESGHVDTAQTRPWRTVRKGYTRFQEGDVLFAKITPCMENGKVAVATGLLNGVGAGSTEFHVLRPLQTYRSDLLRYYMLQSNFRERARARMKGTAGQLRVPTGFLEAQTLPVPPLPQQRLIVETIDSLFTRLDAAAASLDRAQRNLKRYRAAVLTAAVEGRLVPTEAALARAEGRGYEPAAALLQRILAERRRRWEETELAKIRARGRVPKDDRWKAKYKEPAAPDTRDLPALPEGWCWVTVDQLLTEPLANGRSTRTSSSEFPALRLTALRGGSIDTSQTKTGDWTAKDAEPFIIRCGDFLVSRGNGSINLVGIGGLAGVQDRPVAYPDTMIRFRLSSGMSPMFFTRLWNAPFVRDQLELKAKTTAGIFKVNQYDLATCILPMPPLAEQCRIRVQAERVLDEALVVNESCARTVQRCRILRQSILQWAFAGRLVDRDPADEPAEALVERLRAERATQTPTQRTLEGVPHGRARRRPHDCPPATSRPARSAPHPVCPASFRDSGR